MTDKAGKPQQENPHQQYDARFLQLEHRLLEQEHRFISVWLNLFQSFRKGREADRVPALKAVLYSLIPGRVLMLITGGTLIGLVTLLLMYQANLLLAKQNQYFQQQIYVQSNTERRRMLVDIKEKLYDPDPFSKQAANEHQQCVRKSKNFGSCGPSVELRPKFNAQIRTESMLAYLDIQRTPLKQPEPASLPTLEFVAQTILGALFEPETSDQQAAHNPQQQDECKRVKNADLRGAFLQEVYLVGECLEGVNFTGANLSHADLSFVQLERSDINKTNLRGIDMVGSRLSGSNFFDADLSEADMTRSELKKANLAGADLSGAILHNTNLEGANLERAILINARLMEANLQHAKLRGADLAGVDFIAADLFEAELQGARFDCTDLKTAKNWRTVKLDQPCP
ncbi:MAG: hypothetical protein CMK89_12100 [Pseudomonadales bacterium]|nr:hypothetical protein [Pseudomonadales bacterium]